MLVKLTISDDLYEHYERLAEELQSRSGNTVAPEDLMAGHVDRFQHVRAQDRVVVIDSESRRRLEAILHGGSLKDAADLISKVERLAAIEIGGVRIDFTPAEYEELRRIAGRNRRTIEDVIRATINRMHELFFNYVPRSMPAQSDEQPRIEEA